MKRDLARLRRLSRDPRARRDEDAFVVEGPKLVREALDAQLEIETVYAEPGAPDLGVDVVSLPAGSLARAVDATTPQPMAAIARRRLVAVDDVDDVAPVLVLAGVGDPGNAGTLLRSAEAAGFGAVLFTSSSVDPYAPKCVRASAGSVFRVAIVIEGGAGAVLQQLGARGRRRVGTAATGGTPYDVASWSPPVALVLGSEAHGVPGDAEPHVDEWVHIPMAGRGDSLNVAMAGTLLCFEVARRG